MALTPMMQQYVETKEEYSDYILMFRLGDFYEMFFEDAKIVAKELKLALTGKSCGLDEKAPMCGVPFHAVEPYITKLVDLGYKIAICEQVEDPKQKKGIVKREVTRLITPGTINNLDPSKADSNNYLCGIFKIGDKYSIGFIDISTGKFIITQIEDENALYNELENKRPSEIIFNNASIISKISLDEYCKKNSISFTELDNEFFEYIECENTIKKQFNIQFLSSIGLKDQNEILLVGSILRYVYDTQRSYLTNIIGIEKYSLDDTMVIDSFTKRNLELVETMRESKKIGSLFWVLDKTKTSMGARYLKSSILAPSIDKALIIKRHDAIDELNESIIQRDEIREYLSGIYDLERLIAKLSSNSITPKDLVSLANSFELIEPIKNVLLDFGSKYLMDINKNIDDLKDLKVLIENSINSEAGYSLREGEIIKDGYSEEIDNYRQASINGQNWIIELEKEQRDSTGIKNLRIRYNKNFGYCVEINQQFANLVPENYIRRQTLTNTERYTFDKLKEIEDKIVGAQEKLYNLECAIFDEIKTKISNNIKRILTTAKKIAELDFIVNLSHIACQNNYCRPNLEQNGVIDIKSGRHPVIEKIINKDEFIANDLHLDMGNERFAIITGPNMSGKSTYMRQTALICIMAQIGSFVPAEKFNFDIVDKIFTRVGASDDLASGQSTFMVEMTEVANILRNATSKSLIILDEIGRGTSTFDGLSLAWAIVEYIADPKILGAKTIFATHYHEITELEGKLENVVNYYIDVYEKNDNVIFLRKIKRGEASKSYGIQVAKLAGLPKEIIERAKTVSLQLECADITNKLNNISNDNHQYTLFEMYDIQQDSNIYDEIINELKKIDPDNISPKQAIEYLYDIKKRINNVN